MDSVGRGKAILRLRALCTTRRVSPLQAECVSRTRAPYATIAMVTKWHESTSRKRAIRSGGMSLVSRSSAEVARLNF